MNDGTRYPGSLTGRPARRYGPLPDYRGDLPPGAPVALIYHTTETEVVPGYDGGNTAPHYTYDPRRREWWHHAELAYRVGTMKGGSSSRPYANDKAVQVEIVCYSDRSIADQSSRRLWVGDLTDDHHRDLADFAAWVAAGPHEIELVALPVPPGGWTYGTSSPHRLTRAEWYAFGGIGAHGAVPGQTHWDTGVLDLERIADLARPSPPELGPTPTEEEMITEGDTGQAVTRCQNWMRRSPQADNLADELAELTDGVYDAAMTAAVTEYQRRRKLPISGNVGGITYADLAIWRWHE